MALPPIMCLPRNPTSPLNPDSQGTGFPENSKKAEYTLYIFLPKVLYCRKLTWKTKKSFLASMLLPDRQENIRDFYCHDHGPFI